MNPAPSARAAFWCAVLLLITVSGGSAFYWTLTRPLAGLRSGVVEIKRGWGLSEISSAVFPSSRFYGGCFKLYALFSGHSRDLKAGEYLIEHDSIRSLVAKLVSGKGIRYRVTVAEGIWAADIATLLSAAKLGDKSKFLALIHDREFASRLVGHDVPSLEGYLFPETYFFTKGMSESDILKSFVSRFNELARPNLVSGPLSIHAVMTLASMVEREAAVEEERPVIASVFLNRLNKRMNLESCVTVEYALGQKKKQLLDEDLRVESPYNTYRHAGLPPGPVANPGLAAIRAVVNPAQTSYLFFVARGDGRHVFSKTWAEHTRSKRKTAALHRNR